ncbi:IS3 family transposase, partial [Lactobacillus helveticus]
AQGTGERDPKAERRKLALAYCERIRKKTEGLGSGKRSEEIAKLIAKIKEIFNHHQGRYGYRRAALQLIKEGWNITEKTVRYW